MGRAQANADLADRMWNGLRGEGYRIRLRVVGERITHVEKGHTYEYFEFTYANCTRPGVGVGGSASFLAVATNVATELANIQASGGIQGLAENAAENAAFPLNPALGTQGVVLGYTVACASNPPGGGANPISSVIISQCYPNAGTDIRGRSLVAIGRYFGQI